MSMHALPPNSPVRALADRAHSDLQYIRSAMERSEKFTAVSGRGTVLMGLIALSATVVAEFISSPEGGLIVWITAALLATVAGGALVIAKSRHEGKDVLNAAGRRFLIGLAPPVVAGAVLTFVLLPSNAALLPGVWLLLYGTGVLTGGAVSIPIVQITGAGFMTLGIATFLLPAAWGNVALAFGFGGLHLLSGAVIWRKHGG
jgi:hypothetical protein